MKDEPPLADTIGCIWISWPKFERQLRVREYGEKKMVDEHVSENAEIAPDGSNLPWHLAPKVHRVSSVELQKNVANRSRGLKDFDETVRSWTKKSASRTHCDTHQVLAINIAEEDHLAKEGDKYTGESFNRSYCQRSYHGAKHHSNRSRSHQGYWQSSSTNEPSQWNSSQDNSYGNRWQRSRSTDQSYPTYQKWNWNSQSWNDNTENAPWKQYVSPTTTTSAPATNRKSPMDLLNELRDSRDLCRRKRPGQFAEFLRRDQEWQSGASDRQPE